MVKSRPRGWAVRCLWFVTIDRHVNGSGHADYWMCSRGLACVALAKRPAARRVFQHFQRHEAFSGSSQHAIGLAGSMKMESGVPANRRGSGCYRALAVSHLAPCIGIFVDTHFEAMKAQEHCRSIISAIFTFLSLSSMQWQPFDAFCTCSQHLQLFHAKESLNTPAARKPRMAFLLVKGPAARSKNSAWMPGYRLVSSCPYRSQEPAVSSRSCARVTQSVH